MSDADLIEALGWQPCKAGLYVSGGGCITHAAAWHHDEVCGVMQQRLIGARDGIDLARDGIAEDLIDGLDVPHGSDAAAIARGWRP